MVDVSANKRPGLADQVHVSWTLSPRNQSSGHAGAHRAACDIQAADVDGFAVWLCPGVTESSAAIVERPGWESEGQ